MFINTDASYKGLKPDVFHVGEQGTFALEPTLVDAGKVKLLVFGGHKRRQAASGGVVS